MPTPTELAEMMEEIRSAVRQACTFALAVFVQIIGRQEKNTLEAK
jgi:hypothetical protein